MSFISRARRKLNKSSSPKKKTTSLDFDDEVFNNNLHKSMSFPRSTVASSAPRLEIEKRLTAIDNHTERMRAVNRRASHQPPSITINRKSDDYEEDQSDGSNLIGITTRMNKQVTEEKAKEDENIKHQIRKLVEQQNIEQSNIDTLRQDFLKLHPSKTQKPRIDAAYENQKRKIKDKIASLERKKQTLEAKLSSNRNQSNEQLKGSDSINGSDYGFNHNSRNNSASNGIITGPRQGSSSAWGEHDNQDTGFLSMDTSAKSLSTQSLEIKSNTSSNHESSNQHHQSTNSLGLDQQLRDHRDYIDDRMREFEERLQATNQDIHDCYRKIEQNQADTKQEHDNLHEKIVKMVNDFDTSAECRLAEMRSHRNDVDEQMNMLRYGSKSRHEELLEKIEKLEQKLDDMETRQRYRNREIDQQSTPSSIVSEKSLKALIDTLLHLAGMVLLLISSVRRLLQPCTRSTPRLAASITVLILSIILYHYLRH
jgi:hypothetical protein